MDDTCELEELALLDYLLGAAAPEQRALLERSPACRAAAEQLAQRLALLYRASCPDPDLLVAYQERRIADSTLQLVVHRHVGECPHCAEELALLSAIDAVPLGPPATPLRRVVEALFQPPLGRAVPLRGDLLLYQTPRLTIHLRVRAALDRPGAWSVRGQVRTADGQLAGGVLQAAMARSADGRGIDGVVDPPGAFSFERLPAGLWSLTLQTADEELVISRLAIGDGEGSAAL